MSLEEPRQVAIRATGLSKRYRIGLREEAPETLAGTFWGWLRTPLTNLRKLRQLSHFGESEDGIDITWALSDVSFQVATGEVIGIVGRNGAGKSTLLKILSRITPPTSGRAEIHGRVASLLEVGTGFHQELTGRENVYLNGAVLGLSKGEIERKFDEIVEFSGVGRYLDTPIKRYSSGMKVRLAFAVAAHLEAEILLIDEVLAVGDAAFQRKCLGKMGEVAHSGRTVLFVSHNMSAVESLCSRTLWIEDGAIRAEGASHEVITQYLNAILESSQGGLWEDVGEAPGNERVRFRRAEVRLPPDTGRLTIRTPFDMVFEYWNLVQDAHLNLSLHVYNEHNVMVFSSTPLLEKRWHGRAFPKGLFRSVVRVPGDLLNEGTYRVEVIVVEDQKRPIYLNEGLMSFDVLDDPTLRSHWFGPRPGVVRPNLQWTTELVDRKDLGAEWEP